MRPTPARPTPLLALLAAACGGHAPQTPADGALEPPPVEAREEERSIASDPAPPPSPPPGEGQPRFIARRELDVGGHPSGLVQADVDGDGRPDLVAAFERPGGLAVWRSARGGLAAEPLRLAGGGWMLGPVVHRDGALTALVAASRETRTLHAFRLDTVPPTEVAVPIEAAPRALASGPIGPGGPRTVVVAAAEDQLLLWRIGQPPRAVLVAPSRASCLLVEEDGRGVWVASQEPRVVRRYAADDLARDRAEPELELALDGIPRALLEADVDGDGDPELVCFGGDEDVWIWGLGLRGGSHRWGSEPARRHRAPGLVPLAATAADLDGDGREELVSVHAYDTSYGVLGSYDPSSDRFRLRLSEYAGQTPLGVAVADLDGDGRADLAIANGDAQRVSVLPGTGLAKPEKAAFYEARRTAVATNPLGVALGDLDGDGALDAVSANGSAGSLTVLFNRYTLLEERLDLSIGASPTAVRITDLDRDGNSDLVALTRPSSGARLAFRRGTGGGAFGPLETLDLGGDAARLELVDLAGDGAPDLVACDPLGGRVLVVDLPARPPAGFAPRVQSFDLGPRPAAVAGLLGPDGRESLALAHAGPQPYVSLHALDAGRTVELLRAPFEGAPVDLACGDFSGDGAAELALLARRAEGDPQGFLQTWRPLDGLALPGARYPVGLAASEVVAGDLDGDGDDDLAVTAQNTHNVNLFLSVDGTLVRQPDVGAGLGCLGLALGDLNGNGRLDLVVANAFSHDLSTVYVLPSR